MQRWCQQKRFVQGQVGDLPPSKPNPEITAQVARNAVCHCRIRAVVFRMTNSYT